MTQLHVLTGGVVFGEQPRWHQDRLWLSDWGRRPPEVLAVDLDGDSEVILQVPSFPCCVDWLPDGRLLVVSGGEGVLLRQEPDGSLVTHGDLTAASHPAAGNELVVDGRGNAYVNGGGFDLMAGEPFAPGVITLVTPDGTARQVTGGLAFPNGMLITPDNTTLIVAESYAKRLTAFDITPDGGLSNRRVWAELGDGVPDGIAWTPRVRSGTRTSPTSAACGSAKAATCSRRSASTAAASPAPSAVRTGQPFSWWRTSGMVPRTCSPSHTPAKCSPPPHPQRAPAGPRPSEPSGSAQRGSAARQQPPAVRPSKVHPPGYQR